MTNPCDALIIGGGPAGAASALLLARAGWSVVVCEKQTMPRRKVCGEYLSATNLPLLDALGMGDVFRGNAGPPVRRVGLFAGDTCLDADLPACSEAGGEFGRALSRERLDTLLLERARHAGADVRQPSEVLDFSQNSDGFRVTIRHSASGQSEEISTRLILAAHGSWNPGTLPSQPPKRPPSGGDWFGFKAHFTDSALPEGLMPLLSFRGGYGGMVHEEQGRTSISCCVRRDRLAALRALGSGDAGEVLEASLRASCRGVREALDGARRQGSWLAAGPIHPGVRLRQPQGIFPIGNAAGEAHPVVAEGISMALQAAWLLSERLLSWRRDGATWDDLPGVAAQYARDWRRHFASRLRASRAIAAWAMRPAAVAVTLPLLKIWPGLLSVGARWSGKSTFVLGRPDRVPSARGLGATS